MDSRRLTLREVRRMYSRRRCYDNGDGFVTIVDNNGRLASGISFEIPRIFRLDAAGDPVDPLKPFRSRNVEDVVLDMDVNWDGEVTGVLFGGFRWSRRGGPCLRLSDPVVAGAVMVEVSWGGPFRRTRGQREAPEGALYFHHACSRGGGMGKDFCIFPMRILVDEGQVTYVAWREVFQREIVARQERADAALRAKLATEGHLQ